MVALASRLLGLVVPVTLLLASPAMASSFVGDQTVGAGHVERAPQRLALFIRGGCPYNLDKECHRNRKGKMVCRCVS